MKLIILIVFSIAVFSIGLGAMPLTDPDEVFYAETAKEMVKRGELLTPYIFGKPQFEKPPLFYWLTVFSFRAFGVNEFAARLPSAILGVLGVVGIYLLGSMLMGKRAGFLSGIILATSLEYLVLARACVTDMALGVTILYSFLFFFYGYSGGQGKTKWYLLAALFLGLAVLTKGPIGVFLPFVIIGIFLILTKGVGRLKEMPVLGGALVFIAVSTPWYFLMYRAYGKEFIDVFLGFHNVARFLKPEHRWGDVFYYYVPILLGGFFPWTAFLPLGIWQMRKDKSEKIKGANLFLIVWVLVIFLFFSFSRTKLPTYIFPLWPALALLVGRFFDSFLKKGNRRKMDKAMLFSLCIFSIFVIGACIGLYVFVKMDYPGVALPTLITGAGFALLMLFSSVMFLKKGYKTGLIIFMASFIAFVFPLAYIVLPAIGGFESSKEISKELLARAGHAEKFGAETRFRRGVAFYTDREDILDVHPHHVITKFLDEKKRVWCVMKEKNHIQLYTDERKPYGKPTYAVYASGDKVLVTNHVPPDGKFLKRRTEREPY